MPVIYQYRIFRPDLRNNPKLLYLFGDNEQRWGYGGQAHHCRDEPNALGIATKRSPTEFWSDEQFERCKTIIDADMAAAFLYVKEGGIIVIPSDGLGTGLAELPTRAPRIFEYLKQKLEQLGETA